MSEVSKKNLLSQLWDEQTDRVDELRADLKTNHGYLSADEQTENLRIDIAGEVARAGWIVSPNVIEALCAGGASMMTLDASTVEIDRLEPATEAQDGDADAPPPPAPPPVPEEPEAVQEMPPVAVASDMPPELYHRLVNTQAIKNRAGA